MQIEERTSCQLNSADFERKEETLSDMIANYYERQRNVKSS